MFRDITERRLPGKRATGSRCCKTVEDLRVSGSQIKWNVGDRTRCRRWFNLNVRTHEERRDATVFQIANKLLRASGKL